MRFWLRLGKWTRRGLIALAILTAIAAPAVTLGALSYKGFCFDQRRFLSDEEAFTAAIGLIIRRSAHVRRIYRNGAIELRPVQVIGYRDIDEFLRGNPNCCKVVPHNTGDEGPYTDFSQRLFGYAARIVSVTYAVRYVDENKKQTLDLVTQKYAITNCGRAWDSVH